MQSKWFHRSFWRDQDPAIECAQPDSQQTKPAPADSENMRAAAPATFGGNGFAGPNSGLLPFEEIYRSAGIRGPRLGYSISKIIEMLHNEHIRNLPTETKRASLLMALDAAGVQIDEVLQDATMRQRAMNSYEAIQKKHLEEYEARKAQENCAIQAELDRVTAEYVARINGNLDELAHAKDVFRKWQTKKQHEAQRIAEAVALCVTQAQQAQQSHSTSPLRDLPELAGAVPTAKR
jgi:hypothetical protein